MTRTISHLLSFMLLTGLTACEKKSSKAEDKPAAADSAEAKDGEAKDGEAKVLTAKAVAAKAAAARAERAAAAPDCDDPSNSGAASCQEKDSNTLPNWLSESLIPHVKVIRKSNSWAGIGTKTWALQLEIDKAKFNVDSCIAHLTKSVGENVPRLGEPVDGPDGRKTVKGETPDHFVSFMCGNTEKFGLTVFIGVNAK